MKETLLLVTRRFPYNEGQVAAESYLEAEIAELARSFKEVLVVATEASKNAKQTCELPSNVSPIALGAGIGIVSRLRYCIKGFISLLMGRGVIIEGEYPVKSSRQVKGFVFKCYFLGRALTKYELMKRALSSYGNKFSCVYSFWLYDTALASILIASELCCKVVSRAHGYDLYEERNPFSYIPFQREMLIALDGVFPCSLNGERYLKEKYPAYAHKVQCLYLGTRELSCQYKACRGCEGVNKFRLVSCSRLVELKRVDLIAGALKILDEQGIEMEWVHFGDGPMRERIKNITDSFKTIDVDLMGTVENGEVLNFYEKNGADLFLNVSTGEGLPISIMEAMGCGIPVLATNVGGTSEIVKDGLNGVLLDVQIDEQGLARRIRYFAAMSSEERKEMSACARKTWESGFRVKDNARKLIESMGC